MSFLDGLELGWELLRDILTAEPLLTITLVFFFVITSLISILIEYVKNRNLKRSGMLEVDKMPGRRFEEYLRVLLLGRGYRVKLTPATGDYGADLILSIKGKTIIVQAKRYKKKVGIKAVQEIASAKNHFKADECWVITNNFYTKQAIELAASNKVCLIDRKKLMQWMLEQSKSA